MYTRTPTTGKAEGELSGFPSSFRRGRWPNHRARSARRLWSGSRRTPGGPGIESVAVAVAARQAIDALCGVLLELAIGRFNSSVSSIAQHLRPDIWLVDPAVQAPHAWTREHQVEEDDTEQDGCI